MRAVTCTGGELEVTDVEDPRPGPGQLLLQVLREFAIAAGLGRKRPKPCKEARPKMGTEGEDVVADEAGGLKLRLPPRFAVGTMKAAAWQVDHLFLFAGASHVVLVVNGACQPSNWTVV